MTPKFNMYRAGFKYALRFTDYNSSPACHQLEKMHGPMGRQRDWFWRPGRRDPKTKSYLSWIYLKNEADITMLQLCGVFDENH